MKKYGNIKISIVSVVSTIFILLMLNGCASNKRIPPDELSQRNCELSPGMNGGKEPHKRLVTYPDGRWYWYSCSGRGVHALSDIYPAMPDAKRNALLGISTGNGLPSGDTVASSVDNSNTVPDCTVAADRIGSYVELGMDTENVRRLVGKPRGDSGAGMWTWARSGSIVPRVIFQNGKVISYQSDSGSC